MRASALRSCAAAGLLLLLAGGLGPARAQDVPDHLTLLEQLGAGATEELLDQLDLPAGTAVHLVPEAPHAGNWLVARLLARALVARGCTVVMPGEMGSAGEAPVSAAAAESTEPGQPGDAEGTELGEEPPPEDGWPDDGLDEEEPAEGSDESEGEGEEGEGEAEAEAEAAAPAPSFVTAPEPAGPAEAPAAGTSGGAAEAAERPLPLPSEGEVLTFRLVEYGVSYPWAKRSYLVGPRRFGRLARVRMWATWLHQPGREVRGVGRGERVHIDSFPGWARPLLEGENYPFAIEVPGGTPVQRIVEPIVVGGIVASLVYLFYQNQK